MRRTILMSVEDQGERCVPVDPSFRRHIHCCCLPSDMMSLKTTLLFCYPKARRRLDHIRHEPLIVTVGGGFM